MLKVKFNNSNVFNSISVFRRFNEHVVGFDLDKKNISGFKTYEDDQELGDFSDYTFLYKYEDNMTWYSNDGSVYVEPTEDVTFKIIWEADTESDRPTQVKVKTSLGSEINVSDPWEYTFKDVPVRNELHIVDSEEVEGYIKAVTDKFVNYTKKDDWREKIEERLMAQDAQLLYTALLTDTLLYEDVANNATTEGEEE